MRMLTAVIRQPYRTQALLTLATLALHLPVRLRPELGTVIEVSEFVQHSCQQFAACAAVRA